MSDVKYMMPSLFRKRQSTVHATTSQVHSGSMTSMTPSRMNEAIMEILNVEPHDSKWRESCRGDPITRAGQRNQMVRMLAIIMVPVLVLAGLTANSFGEKLTDHFQATELRTTMLFSLDMAYMIRMLQRERDGSALYMSAIAPDTKNFLLKELATTGLKEGEDWFYPVTPGSTGIDWEHAKYSGRYEETDLAIQSLMSWPANLASSDRDLATTDTFLMTLNRHRYELDILPVTFRDELETYSYWLEIFIRWYARAITESKSEKIWKDLVAYHELMLVSEYLGRERAMGVIFYRLGKFPSRDDYLYFIESQDTANSSFIAAMRYSAVVKRIYKSKVEGKIEMIRTKRHEISNGNRGEAGQLQEVEGSLLKAEQWFDIMTFFQDTIREAQRTLATNIDSALVRRRQNNIISIVIICLIFSAVIILCPVIVYSVYKLTNDIQQCSIHIADRTRQLRKENLRSDELLYQMMPKLIAKQLKQNETVLPVEFAQASIMFSDIVGFTQISSRSSPLQIVDMLNMVYSCMDGLIEMYDVYKVETVGDAYLVVSGVPVPNGQRHAAEIAALALDMMEHINRMGIPHIPGTNVRLRIGCHSGSVVAGIVGTRLPHYCVFGESVNITSKMEALGKPCKIHLSKPIADILTDMGGFVIRERENSPIHTDNELAMAFKGVVHTYWLVGRDGFASPCSFSSNSSVTPAVTSSSTDGP